MKNIENISTKRLMFLILLFSIVSPIIFTQHSFLNVFDLSDKGQIGDAIGGITSPFINGLGAILVFMAFKEQIKANELLKQQQYFQHIQEQIHRLEEDFSILAN